MTDNLHDDKNIETPEKDNSQNAPDVAPETKLRHDQQMEGARKEVQRLRDLAIESEVKRAEVDANSIVELHDKDPKMANEVAERFWYSSFEEIKSSLSNDNETDNTTSEKDKFNQWYEEKKAKEESVNAHSEADKILNSLEWDLQTEAKKYYKMMTKGRDLTTSEATEMAKMATLYVNKDNLKSERLQEWLMNFGNTGLGKSAPASKKADSKNKDFWSQAFGWQFAHLYK